MDDIDMRLRCLELATETTVHPSDHTEVVNAARAYFDFVLGTKDAEVIAAARELAKKVGG